MRNPIVLVVDDEPANRLYVSSILQRAGWHILEAGDGGPAVALAAKAAPDLIVMDIDMPGLDGWAATAAIRAAGGGMPILAYSMVKLDDAGLHERGLDGRLPKPSTPEALLAAITPWRPEDLSADTHRLKDVFGQDELKPLIERFRDQLVEALDGGEAQAHRIAGVAGTLGFAPVSKSWLRLSEGDDGAREDARRAARLAIAAIDRGEL